MIKSLKREGMRPRRWLIAAIGCVVLLAGCLFALQFVSDEVARMLGTVVWAMVAAAAAGGFVSALVLRRCKAALRGGAVILLSLVGAVVGFSTSVYLLAPTMLFYPHFDEESSALLQERPGVEELSVDTSSGRLSGWMLHNAPDGAPLVVYFYGNGQNAAPCLVGFQDNGRLGVFEGYNIAVLDYPGYGKTEGEPTEATLKEFGLAVYDALAARADVDPGRITVFGYSIGTGVATYVASQRDVSSVVLMAPYADGYDLYNSMADVFYGPLRALVAFRMESVEFARDVDAPALVLASVDDKMVPYTSSARLAEAFSNCTFDSFKGFGHNDFWASPDVQASVAAFLAKERGSGEEE